MFGSKIWSSYKHKFCGMLKFEINIFWFSKDCLIISTDFIIVKTKYLQSKAVQIVRLVSNAFLCIKKKFKSNLVKYFRIAPIEKYEIEFLRHKYFYVILQCIFTFVLFWKCLFQRKDILKKSIKNWEGILTHKSWFENFQSKNDEIRCYIP